MAAAPNVARVIAFEAHPVSVDVCRQNVEINGLSAEVHHGLVGDGRSEPYLIDEKHPAMSGIHRTATAVPLTPTMRLDHVLTDVSGACVMLVDVEGAELDVLRGGQDFIGRVRPLIIFEYHEQTARHFSLSEVRNVLASEYEIYRLRDNGVLDPRLDLRTLNCVAAPSDGRWAKLIYASSQLPG